MKRKYQLVLKTTTLTAATAIGVSTIAVSCGSKEVATKTWRFHNQSFKSKSDAQKAKENFINKEVGKLKSSTSSITNAKAIVERRNRNHLFIDELIEAPGEKGIFDKIALPELTIMGPNGMATLEKPKKSKKYSLTLEIKKRHRTKFLRKHTDLKNIQNGDTIRLTFKVKNSILIRTMEVVNLKRSIVDFFKGQTEADKLAVQTMLKGFEGMGKNILKDIQSKLKDLLAAAKEFFKGNLATRDKSKLVEPIKAIHSFIDKRFFQEFTINKTSLANKLIETLEKNDVDTTMISDDGVSLKPLFANFINDTLDILKVFIDDSLSFIENSIEWKPSWMIQKNIVNLNSTNSKDKKFLGALKNGLIKNTGDDKDKADAAFLTVQELMSKNKVIYKEEKNGETTYHVVDKVNSRKIANTFRKHLKYNPIDPKGTIDNFHVDPNGKVGSELKKAIDKAKARRKNNYQPAASIYNLSTSSDVTEYLDHESLIKKILPTIKVFLPMIKSTLSNSSFKDLLNMANGLLPDVIGVTGIINIDNLFNSITGSFSETVISMETNLQVLLTYIFGDEGNVVMDFKLENNKFILKDYKSPQITTVDKDNRDTIIYRKDHLDKLFNRIKPMINIGLLILGLLWEETWN